MRKIIGTGIIVVIALLFISFGGYSLSRLQNETVMDSPSNILAPIIRLLPKLPDEPKFVDVKLNENAKPEVEPNPKPEVEASETDEITEDTINNLANSISTNMQENKSFKYVVDENNLYTYDTCKYTKIKLDKNNSKLDFIIPLSYINEYAGFNKEQYQQYLKDYSYTTVFYKVNKDDKTPSQWLPDYNTGNYCYTWLYLANKYHIPMSEKDIQVCKEKCLSVLQSGKKLELI